MITKFDWVGYVGINVLFFSAKPEIKKGREDQLAHVLQMKQFIWWISLCVKMT